MPYSSWRRRATLAAVAAATLAAAALLAPPMASAGLAAAGPSTFCPDGTQPMVTQDEVEQFDVGTAVTGLTVTHGTTPERFTGTYVGFTRAALGADADGRKVDLLLFRLFGAGIDSTSTPVGETPAGIWAGMSGSPLYTRDGALIGAVSYGLNTANGPVAGVTPADYMKRIGVDRLATPGAVALTRQNLRSVSRADAADLDGRQAHRIRTVKLVAGGASVNAFANRTLARTAASSPLAGSLRARDFAVAPGQDAVATPLVAGGNVAVGYGTGDAFTGAIGTVTAICGSTVWAFGHSLDFTGETSLSMHNASVALVVPDATGQTGSYKQSSVIGPQVGTFTTDAFGGLRGQLGLLRGYPVVVSVQTSGGRALSTYAGSVVTPEAGGVLAGMLAGTPALDLLDNAGRGTARLDWAISYRRGNGATGTLTNTQFYAGSGDLADQLAADVGADVDALSTTDLDDSSVTGIAMTLTLQSSSAIEYRFVGAQVRVKGVWRSLRGRSLAKPHRHLVRPLLREYVNGRPRAVSAGPTTQLTLRRSAQGQGRVRFASTAPTCVEIDDELVCDGGDEATPTSFDRLLTQLDGLRPATGAVARVKVGLRRGATTHVRRFQAPGVVTGRYTADFRIRR